MLNFAYDIGSPDDPYHVELTKNNLIGVAHMSGWRSQEQDGKFKIVPPARIGCVNCEWHDSEIDAWMNIDFDKVLNDSVAADLATKYMTSRKFKLNEADLSVDVAERGEPPLENEYRFDLSFNKLSFENGDMTYEPHFVRIHANSRIEGMYKALIIAVNVYLSNAAETDKLMRATFGMVDESPIIL